MSGGKVVGLVALVGGGAAAAYVYSRRKKHARVPLPDTAGWVWPVPMFGDRQPAISDGYGSPRPGKIPLHLGVDVMYPRRSPTDGATQYPPHTPNGAPWSFLPDGTFALAAGSGVVSKAGPQPRGQTVTIVHPNKAVTFYTHMESLLVREGENVIAGQPLGIVGADPLDAEHVKHLHFEIWPTGNRASAIDPAPLMKGWRFVSVDTNGRPSVA
jgi:murein DD-endopeptidase MepM/ murein hydrolase activator NlpD